MRGGVNIAVAGGLPFGVAYLLDGAMHNDPQNNANLPLPFPDALQEFSVATSGLSAQNGMHSGASVNAVTKSGTNNFHGNAFEFIRDHRFNAKNPVRGDRPRRQAARRRACSATSSAARSAARSCSDKLFFFGAYQGTATHADAGGQHRVRSDRGDAGRRLHGVRVAGVQRRHGRSRCARRSSTTRSTRRSSARRP